VVRGIERGNPHSTVNSFTSPAVLHPRRYGFGIQGLAFQPVDPIQHKSMRPVIFDTDIGTDVDDILALVLLAKAPELQLIGVTTVYGDTLLRARIAQVTCDLLQRKEIAVVPGESRTLTGRQIFWAGQEGYGMPGLDQVKISESIGAVRLLI